MAETVKIIQEVDLMVQPIWESIVTAYGQRRKNFRLHPASCKSGEEPTIEF